MIKEILIKQKSTFFDKNKDKPKEEQNHEIDHDMWARCNKCKKPIYEKILTANNKVCPHCQHHFRLKPRERIMFSFDEDTFEEFNFGLIATNPLDFPDYLTKHRDNEEATGYNDAVVCGTGKIGGVTVVGCVMNSFFMMGSMGYIVGESITRSIEFATDNNLPIVIFTASGGARMQEGMVSLMQMAKVSASLKLHSDAKLLYVTVITHPTTGGVTASFASLGDIIIAERHALIGFAGRRVIEQTTKQKLPKDFQTAEFALDHGIIDAIYTREELRLALVNIFKIHNTGGAKL